MKKYRILSGLLAAFALLVGCHAHERNDSVRREAALRPLPDYPFIRYGDNTLQFPSGRADFDTLYHKMDSLLSTGKGKINILHIGGQPRTSRIPEPPVADELFHLRRFGNDRPGRGIPFPHPADERSPKLPYRFYRNMGKLPVHQAQRH